LNTTFPVTFPGGIVYQIGGRPLCSDAKLAKIFPELASSIHDNKLKEYEDGYQMTEEEAEDHVQRMENQVLGIVKHFNEGVDSDTFLVDTYSYAECIKIWNGQAETGGKKKTTEIV